jgi:hypothetical protein
VKQDQVIQNEPPPTEPPEDGITARGGAWFNKRTVSLVEAPFAHELRPLGDGWQLRATVAGKLTVHLADGSNQKFDLEPGDQLSTAGDEMYLFLTAL